MDDIFFCKVIKSLEDVLDDWLSPVLIKVPFFPQPGFEIASIAQLCDDIAIPIAGKDLVALEDVGVIELFEDVNLREEELFKLLALQGLEFNDLYGYNFISS